MSAMKPVSFLLLLLVTALSAQAASLVEGRIYLKDGSVIECTGDDRLQLPEKTRSLKVFRNAFRKSGNREVVRADAIDSVLCWHPKAPEHVRKFVPADHPGWMWVYFETPCIRVAVYAKAGYGIETDGGIRVWQRRRIFGRSRTAYFLQKQGEEGFANLGGTDRSPNDIFRERIARCIDDDPVLAERIRRSNATRSKTVLMLQDYKPKRATIKTINI